MSHGRTACVAYHAACNLQRVKLPRCDCVSCCVLLRCWCCCSAPPLPAPTRRSAAREEPSSPSRKAQRGRAVALLEQDRQHQQRHDEFRGRARGRRHVPPAFRGARLQDDAGSTARRSDAPGTWSREHKGQGRHMLLIGHLDTVFEPHIRSSASSASTTNIVRGPGTSRYEGRHRRRARRARRAARRPAYSIDLHITVVLHGDEEDSGTPLELARATTHRSGKGRGHRHRTRECRRRSGDRSDCAPQLRSLAGQGHRRRARIPRRSSPTSRRRRHLRAGAHPERVLCRSCAARII